MKMKTLVSACLLTTMLSSLAFAHGGRRFEIQVIDNQLVAQGVNTGATSDGFPNPRPYVNAIHAHWENQTGGGAKATLPGFDVPAGTLEDYDLTIQLINSFKWVDPMYMAPHGSGSLYPLAPPPGGDPVFVGLDPGELISIEYSPGLVTTGALGTLTLATDVTSSGKQDIDPIYSTGFTPADTIYVLEWILGTDAPGIDDSKSVYTILSPNPGVGSGGFHHASLYTEQLLGLNLAATAVPEPSTWALGVLSLLGLGGLLWRRRRARDS